MALDELIKRLEHESAISVEEIRKDAEKEAERIIASARGEASEILKSAREAAKSATDAKRKEVEAGTELESAMIVQQAMAETVGREAKKVEAILRKELKARRDQVIGSAVKRFADAVPKAEMQILADKSDEKTIKKMGLANARYSKGAEFTLYSKDRGISMQVSLGRIVEQYRDVIDSMLAKELFGKEK